jgi:ribosomal protein S18 acetylase RimI-like enzyme
MKIEITNYTDVDYPILKEMIFGLYQDDNNSFEEESMTEVKIRNTIKRSITHPDQVQIKIFKLNGIVLGYALLTFFWSNEYAGLVVILDEFYVLPEYRGKGISTQFINQLALQKEYKMINLEVFKANKRALELYKRLGFEVIDRHFMKKVL